METIKINGKSYLIDKEKAEQAGLLKRIGDKPISWDEYCEYFDELWKSKRNFALCSFTIPETQFATQEEATALKALAMLINLRDAWLGEDIIPAKEDAFINSYFDKGNKKFDVFDCPDKARDYVLRFPTYTMALEFLDTFRDLIEQASIFL